MKLRLIIIIATLAALGSTLTSCFRGDELEGDPGTPISFSVTSGSLPDPEVSDMSGTKGAAQADGTAYDFATGDLIAIGVLAPPASTTPRSKTVEEVKTYRVTSTSASHVSTLTYNGASALDQFQWFSASEQILLRAWSRGTSAAPADPATYVAATPFVLSTDQSAGYNEVLYSPRTTFSYGTDGSVSVPLYHQLARVRISITEDSGATSAKTVTIGDGVMALPKTATFADPASGHFGTWTALNASEKEIITPLVEQANQQYSAVLLPGSYAAGGKLINIVIGGETFSYTIPAGGITLAAGYQYNYDITVRNGQITFTVTVTPWAPRAQSISYLSKAVFSVAPHQRVAFSHGNLQAHISSGPTNEIYTADAWRFAPNQWEYCGTPLAVGNWVDLFGWVGASADYNSYGLCSTSSTPFYGNGSTETLKTDWGEISGVVASLGPGWRTLTKAEWEYLLNTRTPSSGVRYAKAKVNGVNGVLLLPDGWSTSYYALNNTNVGGAAFTTNTISLSDWNTYLDPNGAVFLPVAGWRDENTIKRLNDRGFYHSSSIVGDGDHPDYTNHLKFYDEALVFDSDQRYCGLSVRLVR